MKLTMPIFTSLLLSACPVQSQTAILEITKPGTMETLLQQNFAPR